ncbi:MAG: trypsin-like serine protease [Acidimicrobiia bacterium]
MHPRILVGLVLVALVAGAGPARGQADPEPEIVGGSEASPNEFPFMVGLVRTNNPDTFQSQFCAGSLIDPEWVLTVAHCVDGIKASKIQVYANDFDLEGDGDRIDVSAIFVHPEYDDNTLENDVALLRLADPAMTSPQKNDTVRLPLASDAASYGEGKTVVAIGWGHTENEPPGTPGFPLRLRKVELPMVSDTDCAGIYGDLERPEMVCAGFEAGGADTCQGDSGGPLVVPLGDGTHLQVGIVSWGSGCADAGFFGVYTRTVTYACWIAETIGNGTLGYGKSTVTGTNGDDVLNGSSGSDVILGLDGDDVIDGKGGSDVLCGGDGDDEVFGGSGPDILDGGPGADLLDGSSGADMLLGGVGNDTILGGTGSDVVVGGPGDDKITGHRGRDFLKGSLDSDRIKGGRHADLLFGGSGDDFLFGNRDDDILIGGAGFDQANGGADEDQCDGEILSSCESPVL